MRTNRLALASASIGLAIGQTWRYERNTAYHSNIGGRPNQPTKPTNSKLTKYDLERIEKARLKRERKAAKKNFPLTTTAEQSGQRTCEGTPVNIG